jgi:hypothetical protein
MRGAVPARFVTLFTKRLRLFRTGPRDPARRRVDALSINASDFPILLQNVGMDTSARRALPALLMLYAAACLLRLPSLHSGTNYPSLFDDELNHLDRGYRRGFVADECRDRRGTGSQSKEG